MKIKWTQSRQHVFHRDVNFWAFNFSTLHQGLALDVYALLPKKKPRITSFEDGFIEEVLKKSDVFRQKLSRSKPKI